jgi:hypothetical protein
MERFLWAIPTEYLGALVDRASYMLIIIVDLCRLLFLLTANSITSIKSYSMVDP